MKFLIVGLGSMGKRRVRNLQAIGFSDIAGYDQRTERVWEAVDKYAIKPFTDFESALNIFQPDALVISTGPRHHMDYAFAGAARGLSCFIEASVVEAEKILELDQQVKGRDVIMAPSCTMRFFPGPRKIKKILQAGILGKPLNVNYQTGQWLPDWHPWEDIRDYYVSERETGGCREIVPFELTWLNDLFGEPVPLACVRAKVSDMPVDIDDIYHCLLRYPGGMLANLTVEVLSRPIACREMRIVGDKGELVYSADENCVRYIKVGQSTWERVDLGAGKVEDGYINPEEPYIAEMRAFVDAVIKHDQSIFPNNLKDDYSVLQTLNRLEELSGETR